MRIAQVAPLWIPVPPATYGGTELIVSWLTEGLVKQGHKVTLFASGDSKTSAQLAPIWQSSLWRARVQTPHAIFSLLYEKLLARQNEFDIIHDHCEFYTSPYSRFLKPPIVTTLHHPLTEETIILYKKFPNVHYTAISKHQKRSAPGINIVKTIYHGLPMEKYELNPYPKNYLLWLSKITPKKGLADAIKIAKITGENLIISGNILKEYADYFDFRIQPLIDGKQIRFVGACDFKKKIELFKNAKALLFPIEWPEPFGLVVIEAMACGTPVIAYKRGSMQELIKDNETGFLVNSAEEAVQAIKKIGNLNRENCRKHVEKNFNLKTMINRYQRLYRKILRNGAKSATQ